ncbi:MAG TPA: adenosylcobinamide-GDP ribazoletransferase, partial [Alcanivorax sp.]|nr:adenosylcobinamide-GDP ribazoletransferase [Alcanivorax sp.]
MTQPAGSNRSSQPRIHDEWQAFWLAVGFLTRVPMLMRIDYSQALMNRSSVYFPLVGLLLGVFYAGLFVVVDSYWHTGISVALVLAFHL